jgi:hypothetical protein
MKSVIALLFALVASASAFQPLMMATKKVAEPKLLSKTRTAKKVDFLYDDGLTDIERKQRVTQPNFLTGQAKSRIDPTSINPDYADVGNTWFLTSQQTLILNCVVLVVLLSIIKGGGGF